MANIITNNHSVDKSVHQLHETITRQQTAINSIQSTLATQQKDIAAIKTTIADMQTSINHIIHSVSEIATKLGFEITLPSPLSLSTTPPTLPPANVADSTTPAPSSTFDITAAAAHTSPTSNLVSIPTTNCTSNLLELISITDFSKFSSTQTPVVLMGYKTTQSPLEVSINRLEDINNGLLQASKLDDGIKMQFGCQTPFARIGNCGHKLFDIMLERNAKKIFKRIVFIFDPGGTFNMKSIFDLEDKVVFKGSVMIRYWLDSDICHNENATRPRRDIYIPSSDNINATMPCAQEEHANRGYNLHLKTRASFYNKFHY